MVPFDPGVSPPVLSQIRLTNPSPLAAPALVGPPPFMPID